MQIDIDEHEKVILVSALQAKRKQAQEAAAKFGSIGEPDLAKLYGVVEMQAAELIEKISKA